MRNRTLTAWALVALLVAPFAWAGDDDESSTPSVIALMIRKPDDAGWKKLEKDVLPSLRKEYAEKGVLFVAVDIATKADRHQSKMMCNLLSASSVWTKYAEKPGHIVLYNYLDEEVAGVIDPKTDVKKALATMKGALKERVAIEEDEEDEDEEMGADDN